MRQARVADLASLLLPWFRARRRELPWRAEPRDGYRVWISEVMLQQTRVDVVIPYFERFVARFPTLQRLAAAPLDDVLALWSGLGYYSRARNLHKAAQAAAALGGLPRSAGALRDLPGFGPYTAAAVASLAFGEDVALVDGNVARVLARVLMLPGDADDARKAAWDAAPRLLPQGQAGAFNEALMELGATFCTPRKPDCKGCPAQLICKAFANGDPERWPLPKPRKARPVLHWTALHLSRADGALLLARRPEGELFAGLWDLPSTDAPPRMRPADAAAAVLEKHGLSKVQLVDLQTRGVVRQTLTHREVTVRLLAAQARGRAPAHLRWTLPAELGSLGLSSLAAKALRACGVATPARPTS